MCDSISSERYSPALKGLWDSFVNDSKNGTFLLLRSYMDYHADRFPDHSFLFYKKGKVIALFPASVKDESLVSHPGLTYGGLIMNRKTTVEDALRIFEIIIEEAKSENLKKIIYKPSPFIYHLLPAGEDLYALFRYGAVLSARSVSSTIERSRRIPFRDIRKSGIRKAKRSGILIAESDDYAAFWEILSSNLLQKYGHLPVHSLEEIKLLASRFPENIRLFGAFGDGKMLAATVCFIMSAVVHVQYISASPEGKDSGALDLLFDSLINEVYPEVPYFDFGISTEDGGRYLNSGLIYQKEGFGARAVCYDVYTLSF